jgi:uncharacterized protein YdaU (DUF1376 family)
MVKEPRNGLFIPYCAKDFLNGTELLDVWEEVAYRRIADKIYDTCDQLPDNDRSLAIFTKTGRRWPQVKASLIASGKIEVIDGRISNRRCRDILDQTALKISKKSDAGKASVEARKSLKSHKPASTGVQTERPTEGQQTGNEPFNHLTSESLNQGSEEGKERTLFGPAGNVVPIIDLAKVAFDTGLALLTRAGLVDGKARAIIGKWRKDHTDGAVIAAIAEADRLQISDPVPWMTARLAGDQRPARRGGFVPEDPEIGKARRAQLLHYASNGRLGHG